MQRDIKLIFFDMEGQIFDPGFKVEKGTTAPSIWTTLSQKLGPEVQAKEEKTKQKWDSKEYKNYLDWCEDTISIYQEHGLTEQTFNDVINNVPFVTGIKETVEELRKKGYSIAIISGGFKNLANRAIQELGIHHVFAAAELFFDPKTKTLSSWNLLPCDYEGKVDFMKLMMKEHGFTKEQCAFIGDGYNDIHLAKECGFSIAFNGRKELQEVADVAINQEEKDIRAILQHF